MHLNHLSAQLQKDLIASVKTTYPVRDVLIGINLTAVESRFVGIASTVFEKDSPFIKIEGAGHLKGKDLKDLIKKLGSNVSAESSIAMAALNSVTDIPKNARELNAYKIIAEKAQDKNIAVIGHFPFVERLKPISKICRVFERSPRPGDYTSEEMFSYLPQSDVVVITGQTIINGTIGNILEYSENAFKIMLGPSTPLNPVLLDYKIDVIGGTYIRAGTPVKEYITQAAHYRELPGLIKLILRRKD